MPSGCQSLDHSEKYHTALAGNRTTNSMDDHDDGNLHTSLDSIMFSIFACRIERRIKQMHAWRGKNIM